METQMVNELPDLFRFENGERVTSADDWRRRRQELLDLVVGIEYGGMPPVPAETRGELLHAHQVRRLLGARHAQYRLHTGPGCSFSFILDLMYLPAEERQPVVLNGDGCWRYVTDEVIQEVIQRGYVLATFNRCELAPDIGNNDRNSGLYLVYPEGAFGALSAWAWGYHRCVDFLSTLEFVDPDRIAIVGHSRGGKTVLLAGATDERIALTAPNNSGAGGAGCFRHQGPKSETLADLIRSLSYWFGPQLREYLGKEHLLPFDQHSLKALVAPRCLLSTEAFGDLWANPTGTYQTYRAAREAYRFLGAEDRIGIWYREGPHQHGLEDWKAFLDFADWHLRGKAPSYSFNPNPFPELAPAHSWSAPERPS